MKFTLKGIFLLIPLNLVFLLSQLHAQKSKSAHFLGLNPGISVKPFYESGEMDMNILPLVYQTKLYRQLDIRLISVLNFGFRKGGSEIVNYGAEVALPYFFGKRSAKHQVSQGFYLAPVFSVLCYNELSEYNTGFLIEPGFAFLVEEKASLSIGLQIGAGYYSIDELDSKWQNQVGLKIILGNWF